MIQFPDEGDLRIEGGGDRLAGADPCSRRISHLSAKIPENRSVLDMIGRHGTCITYKNWQSIQSQPVSLSEAPVRLERIIDFQMQGDSVSIIDAVGALSDCLLL